MTGYDDYSKLINEAGEIYELHRKKSTESGSKFNIFDIIGITRDENIFSSFIAELLNPRGSHERNDKYLQIFLEMLYDRKPKFHGSEFQANDIIKNIRVETEQFHIVENKAGRIDIILENNDYAIVIENKIDADDQDYQLWRYWQSKKNKKGIILVYLTLDGRLPEKKSLTLSSMNEEKCLMDDDIVCISYQKHILKWLKECICSSPENIAVVIKHFAQNIKKITYQAEDTKMSQELVKILLNGNNLKYADELSKAASLARAEIEYSFFMKIKEELDLKAKQFGFEHCARSFIGEITIWDWTDEKDNILKKIINQNSQKTGAVRLFYEKSDGDVVFIADGKSLESFWYGFISTKKISDNIKQFLKNKEGQTIIWDYYRHEKLPLWKDGIYNLDTCKMEEVIKNVVKDMVDNILSNTRVRQIESTAKGRKPTFPIRRKLKNYIEE